MKLIIKIKKLQEALELTNYGDSEIEPFLKSFSHKYIRRIPKKTGKGWWYIYVETLLHPFKALKDIFGLEKATLDSEYEKNNIKEKYDVDKKTFAMHVLEYLSNRLKWDALFSDKSTREKYSTAEKKNTAQESKINEDVQKDQKSKINRSLIKKIRDIFNAQLAKKELEDVGNTNKQSELSAHNETVRIGRGKGTAGSDAIKTKLTTDTRERKGDIGEYRIGIRGDIRQPNSRRAIKEIRAEVLKLLANKQDTEMTLEDKELLKQYEGVGGLNDKDASVHGVLYEFYTPQKIIHKVWELVDKYNHDVNKSVIEPSCGTGRFAENRNENFDMFELDTTSARIAGILYPNATIKQGEFQKLFMNGNTPKKNYDGKKYDVAVGNPPYGAYTGLYKGLGEGKDFEKIDEYFISRTVDTLKDGGILAMVVPSSFMKSKNGKGKEIIAKKANLLEAWRLPNGTFGTTDVGTDIIVLRKEKGTLQHFTNNWYFENNSDNVIGDERERIGRFGKETYIAPPKDMTFDEAINLIDVMKVEYVPKGELSKKTKAKKEITVTDSDARSKAMIGNDNAKGKRKQQLESQKSYASIGKNMSTQEFYKKYNFDVDVKDLSIWRKTKYDGSIDVTELTPSEKERMERSGNFTFDGEGNWVSNIHYASGNIYLKIEELEANKDKLGKQYDINKSLLQAVLPSPKTAGQFTVSPVSNLAKNYKIDTENGQISLIDAFLKWVGYSNRNGMDWNISPISEHEIPKGISFRDVKEYINQEVLRIDQAMVRNTDRATAQIEKEDKKKKRRECAERLFNKFLCEGMLETDKKNFEAKWNRQFNAYYKPDYSKMPVFIEGMNTHKGETEFNLLKQQVNGISFLCNKGNGILAQEVGVGKTVGLISAVVNQLHTGRAKRPLICVPKAVYKKWIREIHQHFPNEKINELGNFSDSDLKDLRYNDDETNGLTIEPSTISVCTYEALQKITFKKDTVMNDLYYDMLDSQKSTDNESTNREKATEVEKVLEKLGVGSKAKEGSVNWEDCGFDNIAVDEFHNMKGVFGDSKPTKQDNKNGLVANEYQGLTGGTSERAMKMFAICQLIQKRNNGQGVFAASATPFTNSPIEVYNILSMVARAKLKEIGLFNMHEFLTHFAEIKTEWSVKANGEIEPKQVMKNWKNLPELQKLLSEYFDYVTADEAGVIRPKKITHENQIELTDLQRTIMKAETEYMTKASKQDKGATLVAINNMRMATLSPALISAERYEYYKSNGYDVTMPTKDEFVSASPKMRFVCDSVVGAYNAKKECGQIIYVPRGVNDFVYIKKYLIQKGIPAHSIAFMHSGTTLEEKERIKHDFNEVDGTIKVVIGSETIKEGISLNGNTITTYNCMLGWNPTETTQVEGRAWRQGNKQGHVHMIYPLMADSIDSLMYQKYDEKASRIAELWSYKGDTLDAADIDPEELKFDLIKDPEKKAKFKIGLEKDRISNEIKIEQATYDTLFKDSDRLKVASESLKNYEKLINDQTTMLELLKGDKKEIEAKIKGGLYKDEGESKRAENNNKWEIERTTSNVRNYKKAAKDEKQTIEIIQSKWTRNGITNDNLEAKLTELSVSTEKKKLQIDSLEEKKDEYIREAKEKLELTKNKLPSVEDQVQDNVKSILTNLRPMDEVKKEMLSIKKSLFIKDGLFRFYWRNYEIYN